MHRSPPLFPDLLAKLRAALGHYSGIRLRQAQAATALKMLAPWIAVLICWSLLKSGWLALLAYHAQIVLWSRGQPVQLGKPRYSPVALLALPMALAGPLFYLLAPYIVQGDLAVGLAEYGLSPFMLALLIPYFGLGHPYLEQRHWAPLREQTPAAHLLFAGYHLLVLWPFLALKWMLFVFALLIVASIIWQEMTARCRSIWPAVVGHSLADLGVVIAAWGLLR